MVHRPTTSFRKALSAHPPTAGGPRKAGRWVLVALLMLGGCAQRQASSPPTTPNPRLQMTLAVQPPSPRQLDPAHFTLTLKDAQGRPVTKAAVTLNLIMPEMDMGKNAVTLTQQTPGTYAGTGRFTMPGDWNVRATVSKNSDNSVQVFPVTVQ